MTSFEAPAVPLTRLLDDAARVSPDAVAISYLGTRITYRALRLDVDRFAGSLASLGVGPMTRVALVLPDCPQQAVAFFAVLRLGAVVVNGDPLAPAAELLTRLRDSGAEVVVCLDLVADVVLTLQDQTRVRSIVVTSGADGVSGVGRALLRLATPSARPRRRRIATQVPADQAVLDYRALIRAGVPARQAPVEPAEALAVLQFSGGSRPESKAVMLSHTNLVAAAHQVRLWMASEDEEAVLRALPLCGVDGLTRYLLPTMLRGGNVALVPPVDVDDGESADVDTKAESADLYGMVETSAVAFGQPSSGSRPTGSVGLPLAGTLTRIVDPGDPREDMPVGEAGELAINGPQVFLGYWRREADVVPPTINGWWLTGELAVMDADGRFSIVGRTGYAVAPAGDVMRGSGP